MAARDDSPGLLVFIPAPIWGPALLLATYAYHRERTEPLPRDREVDLASATISRSATP